MQQEEKLLEELGYNLNDRATPILRDLILEVVDSYKNYGEKEVKNLVKKKDSYIYIEIGCFDYEIGLNYMWKELERIHNKRNLENINVELYTEIFGKIRQVNIEETILETAKYIKKQEVSKQNEKNETVSFKEEQPRQFVLA